MQHLVRRPRWAAFLVLAIGAGSLFAQNIPQSITVNPVVSTGPVKGDADDPAIWIHPKDPARSVIIGTDKSGSASGLYVWDMSGKQLQYMPVADPVNVDVRYGLKLGNRLIDIAVCNPRDLREIRVYEISQVDGTLKDITTSGGIKTPELDEPYGICLYRRPSDGAMFVIESSKSGKSSSNLHQYRLSGDGTGKVKATYVRAFGNNTIDDVVEGLVADEELGYLYAAEEGAAVRKYYVDRDLGKDDQIVAFATGDGISGDREGIAIYRCAGGTGYILLSSQGNATVKVYRREGDDGNPHKHTLLTTIVTNGSEDTDGLDVTNRPTSELLPRGFMVTHNSPGRNFNLYAWEDIAKNYLTICAADAPSTGVSGSEVAVPAAFELAQNHPNPFNPETQIRFRIQTAGYVRLTVFDITGGQVRSLMAQAMAPGDYTVTWDGRDDAGRAVASGTYAYRLEAEGQAQVRKMVLMR